MKLRAKVMAVVLFGVASCTTACDPTPTAVPTNEPAAQAAGDRHDGVRIYRAVFFGEGELARILPAPWRDDTRWASTESDARADRLQALILDWIDAADPAFFAAFSAAMRSGDHLRVQRMLDRSSELTERALRSVADESMAITLERAALGEDAAGTCVVIAVVYAAVAVKVKLWVSGDEPESRATASSLGRDEVVHALATSLSPSPPIPGTAGGRLAP